MRLKNTLPWVFVCLILAAGLAGQVEAGQQKLLPHPTSPECVFTPNAGVSLSECGRSFTHFLVGAKALTNRQSYSLAIAADPNSTAPSPDSSGGVPAISWTCRALALVAGAVMLLIPWLIFTRGHPLKAMVGKDNRYSNSQFQATLWFAILIVTYLASLILRGWYLGAGFLSIDIPQHLLLLSGLSALTFGGAAAITSAKVQNAKTAGVIDPKPKAQSPSLVSDLTDNDSNQFDFGDFQMVIVTLIAAVTYLVLACHFMESLRTTSAVTLPDVDTTILATFGLGQGAYLTKKAAGTPGKS